jgi:protein-disulfide isomerase
MPVPVWGIIGYIFLLLFLPFAWRKDAQKQRIWPILFFLLLGYSAYSVILAAISTFYIKSYCLMCILSYGINFLLLYFSWLIRKRFDTIGIFSGLKLDFIFLWQLRKRTLPVFPTALCFGVILFIFFPSYWSFSSTLLATDMPSGTTEEGYPWIGAETPQIEIMEFADYQCFQCKKMHFFLRELMAKYPTKIRLIHRHFPLDDKINPIVKEKFHVGSGAMALLATYAQFEGKFWELNDVLYGLAGKKNEINIKELAETIGLNYQALSYALSDRNIRYKVKHDISSGIKMGINGTPAFLINDKVYFSNIPQHILKQILE